MRRAAEEAKKPKSSKQLELTPATLYLLFYNAAQAFGLVWAQKLACPVRTINITFIPARWH